MQAEDHATLSCSRPFECVRPCLAPRQVPCKCACGKSLLTLIVPPVRASRRMRPSRLLVSAATAASLAAAALAALLAPSSAADNSVGSRPTLVNHQQPLHSPPRPHRPAAPPRPPPAPFPLTPVLAERLASSRAAATATAQRLDGIFERRFPKAKREEGMTQEEFEVSARGLMADMSADPLYTAGVSARPGAPKPRFDWPWSRSYPVAPAGAEGAPSGYYYHLGWVRLNDTQWGATTRGSLLGTREWIHRRPRLLGTWVDDVPPGCAEEGAPGPVWMTSCALPASHPHHPSLSPPAACGSAEPCLALSMRVC